MKNSSQAESEIYLGKANKIYGPFSSAELDKMANNGKLADFVWIWDHEIEAWKPLETPPPSPIKAIKTPVSHAPASHTPTSKAAGEKGKSTGSIAQDWSSDAALCYDQFNTISGTLESITETGCILISQHSGAAPKFALKSKIALNILDAKRKDSKKAEARIIGIERENHLWAYRLRWVTKN